MNSVEGNTLALLLMFTVWALGGWLLVRHAFSLHRHEHLIIGLAFGLVAANWLANLLAQVLPVPYAFWLGGLILLVAGLVTSRPWKVLASLASELGPAIPYLAWFLVLTFVFTMAGRGLAIFDEFQIIPLVYLLATGEFPPRFVLNPQIHFPETIRSTPMPGAVEGICGLKDAWSAYLRRAYLSGSLQASVQSCNDYYNTG